MMPTTTTPLLNSENTNSEKTWITEMLNSMNWGWWYESWQLKYDFGGWKTFAELKFCQI